MEEYGGGGFPLPLFGCPFCLVLAVQASLSPGMWPVRKAGEASGAKAPGDFWQDFSARRAGGADLLAC